MFCCVDGPRCTCPFICCGSMEGFLPFSHCAKGSGCLPTSRGVHACNTQHVLWVHVSLTGDSLPWGYSVGSAYLSFRVSEAVTLGPCQAEPKSFASS